jgi:ADP-ribosyl-[dinitrogen reductase] hydrolase
MTDRNRARGALLGLAVGDALGTTLEFTAPAAPAFPTLATGPHREVVGGGPFNVAPGQVTDDTQLACCLAASLKACGKFDSDDVARRYADWRPLAFDVGAQTSASICNFRSGMTPWVAGKAAWGGTKGSYAGNGSLMRTAPIGVFFAGQPQELRRASLLDSAITHYDPRCRLACAAFNAAVACAVVRRRKPSPAELLDAARKELPLASTFLLAEADPATKAINSALADLQKDLEAAADPDPKLCGPGLHIHRQQGFVRVAFRLAFWELLHVTSFETALVDVVNRGGDADTNGAIAGALLGACYGESAISGRWTRTVLDALQASPPGPWRDTYHPRRLLELVP